MNRDQPMPIENEDARTGQPATLRDEPLEREQEMARSDDGHDQPAEEPRTAEVRPGDEREVRMEQDPAHAEGMTRSELTGYRDRFADLQARFIDDPKGATDQAGSLLKEAVDRLMESMVKDGDTEQMRLGMRRYRNALETIMDQTLV
jgi:hypothetical protein